MELVSQATRQALQRFGIGPGVNVHLLPKNAAMGQLSAAKGYSTAVLQGILADWDESKHPRDTRGRFGEGGFKGPGSLPGPEKYDYGKNDRGTQWTPETRAAYVTAMGKAWVDKIIAGDSKLQSTLDKTSRLTDAVKALEDKNESLLKQFDAVAPGAFAKVGPGGEYIPPTPGAKEQYAKLSDLLDKTVQKTGELEAQRYKLNQQASDRFAMKLGSSAPVGEDSHPILKRTTQDTESLSDLDRGEVVDSIKGFEKMVGANPGDKTPVYFTGVVGSEVGQRFSRSYFREQDNSIHLARTNPETVWHELGHWMEKNTPGGTLAAQSYLDTRTKGEVEKPLRELQPDKPGYDADEVARPDKFIEPYAGKIYESGGTELTSMGMQFLKEDPGKMWRRDKDMLYFTLGMIRAARIGGFPWAKS